MQMFESIRMNENRRLSLFFRCIFRKSPVSRPYVARKQSVSQCYPTAGIRIGSANPFRKKNANFSLKFLHISKISGNFAPFLIK